VFLTAANILGSFKSIFTPPLLNFRLGGLVGLCLVWLACLDWVRVNVFLAQLASVEVGKVVSLLGSLLGSIFIRQVTDPSCLNNAILYLTARMLPLSTLYPQKNNASALLIRER
jgi:hypothetical protein